MIVTVTLNAAFARTITVPNFQRGQRHRASAGLPLAGGKGINVARALKALGVPVVATGLAGGQAGLRIVERLTGEAILNDFVRIEGESRTTTAVVDPTNQSYTEINEWGPAVKPEELELFDGKLRYLSQGASLVVFAGSLPRDVADDFYAEAIHELARLPHPLGARHARASRSGSASRPSRSSSRRTRPRPRRSSARSSTTTRTSCSALDEIADRGARNVIITTEGGCYALLREDRTIHRYRVERPARRAGLARRQRRRAPGRVRRRLGGGPGPRGGACARQSPRAPPRRSSSAPAASIRARPPPPAGVTVTELDRSARSRRACRGGRSRLPLARTPRRRARYRVAKWRSGESSAWTIPRSTAPRSSARRASPSTTSCSCRPSRRVLPNDVSTATRLTRTIALEIPIVSAAMDTVTEARMAIALAREGGIGIVHRNLSIADQVAEVDKVKRSESGMIVEPLTLPPDALVADALELMEHYHVSGVPITDEAGRLVGILTNRDLRFEKDLEQPVSALMTSDGARHRAGRDDARRGREPPPPPPDREAAGRRRRRACCAG